MTSIRKFGRDLVQALAREPRTCDDPACVRAQTRIVPECPGCRAQRLAAGKTIEEWYDDDTVRE
jgi:hypothetical protein